MPPATTPALRSFFRLNLGRWEGFYQRETIRSRIYQEREATAVRFAETMNLPAGSLVLDAGCGPGFTSATLARKGHVVHALDFLEEMAAATKVRGMDGGAGDRVRPTVGDAARLPFADRAFDLVIVLGVTEWVAPLDALVGEAARVLKRGGHLIIAWNNRWSLHLLLDPAANPLLGKLRRMVREFSEARGWITPPPPEYRYSFKDFQNVFRVHGLAPVDGRGIGFGPFSFLWRSVLPERLGHQLNSRLQELADTRMPVLQALARNRVAVASKTR